MREGRYWYVPSVLVGLAVTVAFSIAFANVLVGLIIGAGVAIVLLWEARFHRR